MTVGELAEALNLVFISGHDAQGKEIARGYASDLLSDVMANAKEGDVWITTQVHQNIVAVAALLNLSAVVVTGTAAIQDETARRAQSEGVVLLRSPHTTFETVGRMYNMGIRGDK